MQNLPSNSKLSKLIKQCFKAPQGELFVGADFTSLTLGVQSRNTLC